MSFSYIKPAKKTPITKEVLLILTFFGVSFFLLFATYGFLVYKDYRFKTDIKSIEAKKQELANKAKEMQENIVFIEKEQNLANKIYTTNSVIKESIHNLFDLVPDSITLSEAQIMKNGLILYGITPSRDVYEYMLQAPLRSIFAKNHTSFYQLENGWLRFVSTNYLDNSFEDFANED